MKIKLLNYKNFYINGKVVGEKSVFYWFVRRFLGILVRYIFLGSIYSLLFLEGYKIVKINLGKIFFKYLELVI